MNNNQISNPKTNVPVGINLNDKDYGNALLTCLKEMVKNYSVVLTEASNETLYQEYKNMFDIYSNLQRKVYELLFRKGWYTLEKAEDIKIKNRYQMLNQEFIDLNS